jgi:hypothetical protein
MKSKGEYCVTMREDGLIERPKTGHQSNAAATRQMYDGEVVRTYHNLNGMWGEKLFHKGEWAIYRPEFRAGSSLSHTRYTCVLIHSKIWEERRAVHREPNFDFINWAPNDEIMPSEIETETIELICHTQLYPKYTTQCHTCRATIPEGVVAIWKMLNADCLSEET